MPKTMKTKQSRFNAFIFSAVFFVYGGFSNVLLLAADESDDLKDASADMAAGLKYYDKREYDRAFELFTKASVTFETVHGDNHPDTADSYDRIAEVYSNYLYSKKDYDRAIEYHQKALAVRRKVHGDKPSRYR
ncbi:hypothetical protein CHS0354_018460 [Potamilus streckersoni]|uniref:Tetratricopeptide repeat protein n=1 Tax=Potamilus streckersoni TaxID=2493646 RepID=A0AAE0TAY9_9BIVA|nr:hypothetical protein CHS0354_018460 [Potamilus streckersoni]